MSAKFRYLKIMTKTIVFICLAIAWAWGVTALYLAAPSPSSVNIFLAAGFALYLPVVFIVSRSFIKGLVLCLGLLGVLLFWWQTLTPTNVKDWAADVSQISHGEIRDDRLTMYNVRKFDYKSEQDFVQRWYSRTYDFNNLQGLDIFLSYWASEHIAHTILSWDFGTDGHLAVSIETRKDKTLQYSAVKGFFKQYEIAYVAADERDIIWLRTNIRKERVYLYRLRTRVSQTRALLENYLVEMNSLVEKPQFYDALTRNCTTTIEIHANAIRSDAPPPLDWRIIATGHVDELLYDRRLVSNDIPFADLRKASRVDLKMQQLSKENFSKILRETVLIQKNKKNVIENTRNAL